jgi:hypothetical protein
MGWPKTFIPAMTGVAAALASAAPQRPSVFSQTLPGMWEISGAPGAKAPTRQCLADIALLAQYEHRNQTCVRRLIADRPSSSTIEYSCGGAGFGRTDIVAITPRSLRIGTQGISGGLPFNYVLQVRRMGDCPGQSPARH